MQGWPCDLGLCIERASGHDMHLPKGKAARRAASMSPLKGRSAHDEADEVCKRRAVAAGDAEGTQVEGLHQVRELAARRQARAVYARQVHLGRSRKRLSMQRVVTEAGGLQPRRTISGSSGLGARSTRPGTYGLMKRGGPPAGASASHQICTQLYGALRKTAWQQKVGQHHRQLCRAGQRALRDARSASPHSTPGLARLLEPGPSAPHTGRAAQQHRGTCQQTRCQRRPLC